MFFKGLSLKKSKTKNKNWESTSLMVVKFFKMTSPKAVCILFQVLAALIVIEFF